MRAIAILALILAFSHSAVHAKGKKVNKVVLDAGHGGKDMGAQGAISYEKDIALAVTLKLGRLLSDSMRNMDVVYTRTEDAYPSLVERHEIANKSNADLFIAIHVNSTPYTYTRTLQGYKTVTRKGKKVKQPIYKSVRHHTTSRSGVETYVMGLHRSGQQKEAIGEYGDNVTEEPGLLNENDPQTVIIVEQYRQAFLDRSVTLAKHIQEQFAFGGRADLGVKQKGLEVLAGSAMPGVLVEIGFITNIEEEAYLNSERGQMEVAVAIYRAIKAYKDAVEK
ncbi:MAG: N-acetylmuramoyl-L-alanine amidase [Taibaiella sp.]|nr:N-acetylmuramoyl-L-alanine amidase [Taibaiella sp.]